MKKTVFLMTAMSLLTFSACQHNVTPNDPSSKLSNAMASVPMKNMTAIEIQTGQFDSNKTNLRNWYHLFATAPRGTSNRVALFSSAQALASDNQSQNIVANSRYTSLDYVSQTINQRLAAKGFDWGSNDLLVVSLSDGGPPFGELDIQLKGDTYEVCVKKEPNPSGISGRALRYYRLLLAVDKGKKAKRC